MPETVSGPRRRGRPQFDDREYVLGFMTPRIAAGMTVTEAAKDGLTICGYKPGADGVYALEPIRHLPPATLARRYHAFTKSEKAEFARICAPFHADGAKPVGISAPKPSLSFISNRTLKRGRPKKKSRRTI
ncbi:MAG: hypothetical protein WCY29_03505 [Novosphingobium sp.]